MANTTKPDIKSWVYGKIDAMFGDDGAGKREVLALCPANDESTAFLVWYDERFYTGTVITNGAIGLVGSEQLVEHATRAEAFAQFAYLLERYIAYDMPLAGIE